MTRGIFVTKPASIYDDLIEDRYHFPKMYLNQASACVGDNVIFYEPRRPSTELSSRGGRQAYFATARIKDIVEDRNLEDHYFALIDTPTFIEFTHTVPFAENGAYYEGRLRKSDGSTNKGLFGRAIRTIEEHEYAAIIAAGFHDVVPPPISPTVEDKPRVYELADPPAEFERPIVERLIRRPFREQAFATNVRAAYDARCAITGIRQINGGGRAEMEAAHIRPVEDKGPDTVRNGIALSRTFHWLFDRGLLSIADDFKILVAERHVDPTIDRLLPPNRQLQVPSDPALQPHPQYLRYHRENKFKG